MGLIGRLLRGRRSREVQQKVRHVRWTDFPVPELGATIYLDGLPYEVLARQVPRATGFRRRDEALLNVYPRPGEVGAEEPDERKQR